MRTTAFSPRTLASTQQQPLLANKMMSEEGNGFELVEGTSPDVAPPVPIPPEMAPPAPLPPGMLPPTPLPPVADLRVSPERSRIPDPSSFPPIMQPPVPTPVALPPAVAESTPSQQATVGLELEETVDEAKEREGVLSWLKSSVSSNQFVASLAEKAKHSVDSMITTLDPQMQEYIRADGSIEIALASDDQETILGVKDGFLRAFSNVTARGLGSPGSSSLPPLAKGMENGVEFVKEKAAGLRSSGLISNQAPLVAAEGIVFKVHESFFHVECVLLEDPVSGFTSYSFSQTTPLPPKLTELLQRHTPHDYPHSGKGYAISLGKAWAESEGLGLSGWGESLGGHSRKELCRSAAATVAFGFKNYLQQKQLAAPSQ